MGHNARDPHRLRPGVQLGTHKETVEATYTVGALIIRTGVFGGYYIIF